MSQFENKTVSDVANSSPAGASVPNQTSSKTADNIPLTQIGAINPLASLKASVMRNASEIKASDEKVDTPPPVVSSAKGAHDISHKETPTQNKPVPAEEKPISTEKKLVSTEEKPVAAPDFTPAPAFETELPLPKKVKKVRKTSSLLAKCMPYISDDHGNYVPEKPDYTLESVEDIIESAKKRADEKIAMMYNLKPSDVERIGNTSPKTEPVPAAPPKKPKLRLEETSIKKALKIGDATRAVTKYDTVQIPKITQTLFDDLTGRRTDVFGEENVITTYSTPNVPTEENDGATRAIPDLSANTKNESIYEDIMSSSKKAPPVDIFSSSKKRVKKPLISSFSEEADEVKVDEFRGAGDVKRVGGDLKFSFLAKRLRFFLTLIVAVVMALGYTMFSADGFAASSTLGIIMCVCFFVATAINLGIFAAFATAFTRRSKIELPLAVTCLIATVYTVLSIFSQTFTAEFTVLPVFSLLVYDYCSYRKSRAILDNFRIVASRKPKKAVALVNDHELSALLSSGNSEGDIITAVGRSTEEIGSFLKNTHKDRPFGGKINVFTAASLVATAIIASAVGVSYGSVTEGFAAACVMLCLAVTPSLFISDMLPFAGLIEKIHRMGAGVCSKTSAKSVARTDAVCLSSAELFPKGTIRLHNISAVSSNELDETVSLAAAVALEAGSPLYPMLHDLLVDEGERPVADSVKYEENLGLSGWVGDNHIMIGNRSLLLAHGVRVPELEVDRKILEQGFFPVYIACDGKACALLTVRYKASLAIETQLVKLINAGVMLYIRNCDSNITEEMVADYYGLDREFIKILGSRGENRISALCVPKNRTSAHAFYRGGTAGFLSAITGSMRLGKLSSVLYVLHIISTVVLWLVFAGFSLAGTFTLMSATSLLLAQLISVVISLTAYFAGK